MDQCPQCSGGVVEDPETGALRCLSCWRSWFSRRPCPGHRPVLNAGLRRLADARDLRR